LGSGSRLLKSSLFRFPWRALFFTCCPAVESTLNSEDDFTPTMLLKNKPLNSVSVSDRGDEGRGEKRDFGRQNAEYLANRLIQAFVQEGQDEINRRRIAFFGASC
jgi:hypothetical protein